MAKSKTKSFDDAVKLLFNYFEQEAKRCRPFHKWNNVQKRTMHALGIGRSVLKRCLNNSEVFAASADNLETKRRDTVDSFDLDVIKRAIFKMFEEKEYVTIRSLKKKLFEQHDLDLTKFVLWKALHKLKFKFGKLDNSKIGMTERQDIVLQRVNFLKEIKKKRESGSPIVYLDETWVDTHHVPKKHWHLPGQQTPKVPMNRGQRLVILHAGSKHTGFIPNCQLVFKSISTDGRDYHTEMNGKIFEDWVKNKLVPNLQPNSTVVMDNASYHSVRVEGTSPPTSATRKGDMQNWLTSRGIVFDKKLKKPELYEMIKLHKTKHKYKVDEYLKSKGHCVLRLPPYNCDLNPIELIWGDLKSYIARNNSKYTVKDLQALVNESFDQITLNKWEKACEHVENKIEKMYWKNDNIKEEVNQIVIDFEDLYESDENM